MSRAQVKPGDRIKVVAPSLIFVGKTALVRFVDEKRKDGDAQRIKVAPDGGTYPVKPSDCWSFGHLHFEKVDNEPSNDSIPEDEMLLAEAIAEARARGLKHTRGAQFRFLNGSGQECASSSLAAIGDGKLTCCCALGALAFVKGTDNGYTAVGQTPFRAASVWTRNDAPDHDENGSADDLPGMTFGRAFRHAMTD